MQKVPKNKSLVTIVAIVGIVALLVTGGIGASLSSAGAEGLPVEVGQTSLSVPDGTYVNGTVSPASHASADQQIEECPCTSKKTCNPVQYETRSDTRYTAQTEDVTDNTVEMASTLDSWCWLGVTYETYPDFKDDMEPSDCTDYDDDYDIHQVGYTSDDNYLYFMWKISGEVGEPAGIANFSFWAWIDIDSDSPIKTGDSRGMDYLVDYTCENGQVRDDWTALHDATSTDWPPKVLYTLKKDIDYCRNGSYLEVKVPTSFIKSYGAAPKIWMGVDVNFFSVPLKLCMDEVWAFTGEVDCSVVIEVTGMVAIEEVTCFEPGDTLYRTVWFRDSSGQLADPQSKTISLHVRPGEPDEYTEDITHLFTRPTIGVYTHTTEKISSTPTGQMILEVEATFGDGCKAEAKKEYEIADDCRAGCSIEIEFNGGKICFTAGETLTRTVRFKDRSGALADPLGPEITWGYRDFVIPIPITDDFSKVSTGVWENTETVAPNAARGTYSLGASATFPDHCKATAREYYEIQGASLCTNPDPLSHDFGDVPKGEQREWSFQITNCGSRSANCESTLEWKITEEETWITKIEPASEPEGGTTSATETITVTIDTTDLEPGTTKEGNITITSNGGTKTGTIKVYVAMPLGLSLRIEDALEGVPVNKVVGKFIGTAGETLVEIVTEITSHSKTDDDDIPVVLTIPNDLFGDPVKTWTRDTTGGALTEVSHDLDHEHEDLDPGQYRVTIGLSPVAVPGTDIHRGSKQIVWRFKIPDDLSPQDIKVTAKFKGCKSKTGTVRILADGQADAIIITNRKLLYKYYDEGEVTSLLQRLFTEAQGPPGSNSPIGLIYYVDWYSEEARNWDNTKVDYKSADTANTVANKIHRLIQDWHVDALKYRDFADDVEPDYLLIVGDDDVIPFHRCDDPRNDELWISDASPCHTAIKEGYIFTDNRYADMRNIYPKLDDWSKGDIELAVGRLVGVNAGDMLNLLKEGVNTENGKKGNVVMASVGGRQLGDVPERFVDKGFGVRNDDKPKSEVCTIDVSHPFEVSTDDWAAAFRDAANDTAGMDLFYIASHGNRNHADLPGKWLQTWNVHNDYPRLGTDHPIVFFTGCHTGFLYGGGGIDSCLAYRLIHEGVRGFIAPIGGSYYHADPNKSTCDEQFSQGVLRNLVTPSGSESMPIGKAVRKAKEDYDFPYISKGAQQERAEGQKIVVEYNLYGVPWAFIHYPTTSVAATPAAGELDEHAFTTSDGPVERTAENKVYSRTFAVDVESYDVGTETQGDTTYDLFSIEGGDMAFPDDAPILPYVSAYRLWLPPGANLTGVEIVDATSSAIGTYNIPIAEILSASEGGLTYTTNTDIDYSFPKNEHLVQYQLTSEGLLFTVFPIQHNPTTDQTTFYSHFEVQVTYESPTDVVVTEFATDKRQYVPGETISTNTHIENLSDANATLTAKLEITNIRGEVVATQTSGKFTVPSGGSSVLPLEWSGELDDGAYGVQVSLHGQEGIVGGASEHIAVMGGTITALTMPPTLTVGEEGIFQVSFANYGSNKVSGDVSLAIHSSEGSLVEKLPPQPITVAGHSTETVTFIWTPIALTSSRYNVVATVVVNGQTYGPTSRTLVLDGQDDGLPVPPPLPPQPEPPLPPPVVPGNPPVVSFTFSPVSPVVRQSITFDGSASYHPAGEIVSYEWNFGDGEKSSGVVITHTYATAGDYAVSLRATGDDGISATYSTVVQIRERQQGLPVWIWIAIGAVLILIAAIVVWRRITKKHALNT